MTALSKESLLEDVRTLFQPAEDESRRKSRAIGAELEVIPVYGADGRRVLAGSGKPNGNEFVASVGREFGWTEEPMGSDPSCWEFPDGRVTFEPGGQIEFSSAVNPTPSALIQSMEKWMAILGSRAERSGIELKTIGIDDINPIEDVPLQLHRERYAAMTRYFDSLSPFGVLMMRQTASLQINVDRGEEPLKRWRLLNGLAPYLVAIFANSPRYAGADTGHKSYRAHVWRMLDSRRTGVIYDPADPVRRYFEFALEAPVILADGYPPFRELLSKGLATKAMWDTHLSTLFPEIRPREYFEIRSIDAVPAGNVGAAVAFVSGLVYSESSAEAALDELRSFEPELLTRAGHFGLNDPDIRKRAEVLTHLALDGCKNLGPDYITASDLERARQYFKLIS